MPAGGTGQGGIPPPPAIGRYRPETVLGAGAMGVVYRAYDPVVDRPVAIKVMRTAALDAAARAEYLQRFRAEVRAAGRCVHPAIVAIYDFCDDPAEPYIVMEYVEGTTLAELLRERPVRNLLALAASMLQVLEGLAVAHGFGVVHRDIKPANIMLSPSGQAKIADFGIARMDAGAMTMTGVMIGTPRYMAPEQALGQPTDRRADLFAAAAILYEIAVGRPPFAGATLAETLRRLTGPDPAPLEPVRAAAGAAGLAAVLERGLAKDPERRFQTAQEFAANLRAALGPSAPDATVLAAPRPASATSLPQEAAGFDPDLLRRLEEGLAQYLGPVAPAVVRRSAARAATLDQLYRMLDSTLERPEDRAAFAHRTRAGLGGGTLSRRTTTGGGTLSGAEYRLPAAALAAAEEVLAAFVGPVAKVLVRRAAGQSLSAAEFQDRLVEHLARPDEKAEFRRRLQARLRG